MRYHDKKKHNTHLGDIGSLRQLLIAHLYTILSLIRPGIELHNTSMVLDDTNTQMMKVRVERSVHSYEVLRM